MPAPSSPVPPISSAGEPERHRSHPAGAPDDGLRTPARRHGRPVFVERFGRRRRLLRCAALLLGCACAGYIAVFVFAMAGAFQDPAGQPPPRLGDTERARGVSDLVPRDTPASSADPRAPR